jgi:hypothetical protein
LKLINGQHLCQTVAAIDQNGRVAGEGGGITGQSDDTPAARCGDLPDLGLGALPGRIEQNKIDAAEFGCGQRFAKQVPGLSLYRLEALTPPVGEGERRNRPDVEIDRQDRQPTGQGKSECAHSTKQVGHPAARAKPRQSKVGKRLLACFGRLKKGCGRRSDGDAGKFDERRRDGHDRMTADGNPANSMVPGNVGEHLDRSVVALSHAADVTIQAVRYSRKLQVHRWRGGDEQLSQGPCSRQCRAQFIGKNQAAVERDKPVTVRRHEADRGGARGGASGVKHDASAAATMGLMKWMNQRSESMFRQYTDDQRALPLGIALRLEMLKAAAATIAEVRTRWKPTLRGRMLQRNDDAMVSLDIRLDELSWKCKRNKYGTFRALGDTLAPAAKFIDLKSDAPHGAARRWFRCGQWVVFGHFSVFLNQQSGWNLWTSAENRRKNTLIVWRFLILT